MRIARISIQYRNERTKGTDINGTDCKYIMCICNHSGITQDEIASKMSIDKSNVARRLSELEKNGYIIRSPKIEDKRNMEVRPTEKAEKIFPFVKQILNDWDNYITEDLSSEEIEQFLMLLEKIKVKSENWQQHKFQDISF